VVKKNYPNLFIIAGTGTKSGKTTMACKVIEQFRHLSPVGIKISPHFHTSSPGLLLVDEGPGFAIYAEKNAETTKDTSRMLSAGAAKVYLILVWDSDLEKIFLKFIGKIPDNIPVVCESPALRNYFEPGLFILMSSETTVKRQDLRYLEKLPHLDFKLEEIDRIHSLPFIFKDGEWSPLEDFSNLK
jgi:hypothetical protein